jgi:hypothetical protein
MIGHNWLDCSAGRSSIGSVGENQTDFGYSLIGIVAEKASFNQGEV